jgi:chromate transport protein ChrA
VILVDWIGNRFTRNRWKLFPVYDGLIPSAGLAATSTGSSLGVIVGNDFVYSVHPGIVVLVTTTNGNLFAAQKSNRKMLSLSEIKLITRYLIYSLFPAAVAFYYGLFVLLWVDRDNITSK